MKKPLLFASIMLIAWSVQAQEATDVSSKITEVTVYLQNAQITREAQIQVSKGDNILRFPALETGIDPGSIQAAAPDMVLLNSVRHEINYLRDLPKSAEVRMLEDSLKWAEEAILRNKAENAVNAQELQMIQQNQSIGSKEKGLSADALAKMADFYRNRVSGIQSQQFKLMLALRDLEKTQQRLNAQLGQHNARRNQPSNDIVVLLKSDYARSITVALRYVVTNAGWVPAYDLRAADLTKPIRLDYRADVRQTTGIDWDGVKITLSTGNPSRGGTKPELSPWNLYVSTYLREQYGRADQINSVDAEYSGAKGSDGPADDGWNQQTLANYTAVTEGAVMTEFKISVPQKIPSDNKAHQVFIQSSDLPAVFHHYAAPKLDKDAFLLAGVTGWESLNLLPGTVNIFFEGTYVSRASLNPSATSDTLNFSMGRDPKVVIQRELLKDHNSQRTIGLNKERTFGYEISVRNGKSTAITLELNDQLPISQDASVVVKIEDISGAEHDIDTGHLRWKLSLQPNETKKIRLIYSIKYPKNKIVNGI